MQLLWKIAKELQIELPYEPAILFLGIYPKELKSESQRGIFTTMFIGALFTITERWKQPKCSQMDEWMDKDNVVYTYMQWNVI